MALTPLPSPHRGRRKCAFDSPTTNAMGYPSGKRRVQSTHPTSLLLLALHRIDEDVGDFRAGEFLRGTFALEQHLTNLGAGE